MKYKITLVVLLAWCFQLYPSIVNAVAVSEAEVKSHINQQLDIRIKLLSIAESDIESIAVKIKYLDTTYYGLQPKLYHEIIVDEQGPQIRVYTRQTIKEPAVSFLLEIEYDAGALIREYSVFIDPAF